MNEQDDYPEWYIRYLFECECQEEIPLPFNSQSQKIYP